MMLSLMNTAKPSHIFLVPNILLEADDNKICADHFTLASQLANVSLKSVQHHWTTG